MVVSRKDVEIQFVYTSTQEATQPPVQEQIVYVEGEPVYVNAGTGTGANNAGQPKEQLQETKRQTKVEISQLPIFQTTIHQQVAMTTTQQILKIMKSHEAVLMKNPIQHSMLREVLSSRNHRINCLFVK